MPLVILISTLEWLLNILFEYCYFISAKFMNTFLNYILIIYTKDDLIL